MNSMPRLNLATALGIVAVIALGLAGLVSASTFWTSMAATLTLALLLGAILGTILLPGADRAMCLGFALFGGIYLLLVDWDWFGGQLGHDLTTGLSDLAESLLTPPKIPVRPGAASGAGSILDTTPPDVYAARQVRLGNFVQIGRMSLALLFGILGGFIALQLHRYKDQRVSIVPPSS